MFAILNFDPMHKVNTSVLEKFAGLVNKISVIFLRKFKNRGKLGLIKEIFDSDTDKIKEKK